MMSYRVGFHCFSTTEEATDYKMSQVVPTYTQDGQLVYPVKRGNDWFYGGQKIQLSHGQCNPTKEFSDGVQVGLMFLGLFVMVYLVKVAKYAINEFFAPEERAAEE